MEKQGSKKIAIVGGGVTGLAALWLLNEHSSHDVELFEACPKLGGHANTIHFEHATKKSLSRNPKGTPDGPPSLPVLLNSHYFNPSATYCADADADGSIAEIRGPMTDAIEPGREPCSVDTAFLMINKAGWPNFCQFLNQTSVNVTPSCGTFSVTRGSNAWSSRTLSSLFAGAKGLWDVRRWTMIIDIVRFRHVALDVLREEIGQGDPEESVGQWCERNGFSDAFINDYLVPLAATVWSIAPLQILNNVPIRIVVEGLCAMDMLKLYGRCPWLQIQGGSRAYVQWIADRAQGKIHVSTPVTSVSDTDKGATITLADGTTRTFDHIIMATHADTSCHLLKAGGSLRPDLEDVLTASEWSECEVIMHYDERLMPPNPKVWSAWNNFVDVDKGLADRHSSSTFDLNLLHHLDVGKHGHVFGSINPPIPIDETKIIARLRYSDFALSSPTLGQRNLVVGRVSLAGAWTGLGTHEDGWNSGIAAAEALGGQLPWAKHARCPRVPELGVSMVMWRMVCDFIAKLWAILVSWLLLGE